VEHQVVMQEQQTLAVVEVVLEKVEQVEQVDQES
jgi:hypothetical protein